jgi:lysyl-tRNA synthetase class 2
VVQQSTAQPAQPDAPTEQRSSGPAWHRRVPGATAFALVVLAVVCSYSAVGLAIFGHMQPFRELVNDLIFPAPPNFAYGAFLGVLAAALARRKYIAHRVLVVILVWQVLGDLLVLGTISFTGKRDRLMEIGVHNLNSPWGWWVFAVNIPLSLALIGVLLATRAQFYGRAKSGSISQAVIAFISMLVTFVVLGTGLVWLFPGSLRSPSEKIIWTIERVLGGAVVMDITRTGHAPGWINLVLSLFGAASLFTALFLLFRAQRVASALSEEDERRIRLLLAESGERDSLGYFATRRDKAVLFSPSGKAAITYRVVGGVCLASGDPLGDPEAWGPVVDRWLAMCREYTWTAAVIGASEQGAAAYNRAGLKVLQLGDEAILNVSEFNLDGRDMRPVRQAVNRVSRAGYTPRIRLHAEIPAAEMAKIAELAERWRDTDTERGFSMALGRLGDPRDGNCVLVEALDADENPVALLSLTPWGRHGLSLDLMRRDSNAADNGLVEFMVSSLVQAAPRFRVERISLNFAMFRSAFEEGARIGAGPVLRAWRALLLFFSRWWQLESLYRSNVKYQPHWVPRFVAFGERRDLARVGIALAVAEGFLSVPGRPGDEGFAPDPEGAWVPDDLSQLDEDAARARMPEQARVRLDKLTAMRERGEEPYPVEVPRSSSCREVAERHPGLAADARTAESLSLAGRVLRIRNHGGVCFATLRDWSGDLQVMLTRSESGEQVLTRWRREVDIGDQISVEGAVATSRTGELSLLVTSWTMAAKCLYPLPDKHHGLTDPEARVRHRYLDLVSRPEARDTLRSRSLAVHALRETLVRSDFLEVETPILQPVHGGANARPFTTHINAYDLRLYLRIAPELYLKRLCVGGVEKLFELGRTFRNEGVSYKHNPEFTMLEAYQAFGDYRTVRELAQRLVQAAAEAANGKQIAWHAEGGGAPEEVDLGGDWPVVSVNEAISAALGEEVTADTTAQQLRRLCDAANVPHDPEWERGSVLLEMYERLVEARTQQPTFYTDFPTDVSPLTRQHRRDARLAERWDLVAFGTELGTGYSELTDPLEQRQRLTAQSWLAANGDAEAMEVDEDFLTALDYAMPPTGGLGIGVDRLVMLLTGKSIRETLPFPLVRPSRS